MGKPRTEEQKAARRATKKANRKMSKELEAQREIERRETDARLARERQLARDRAEQARREDLKSRLAVGANCLESSEPKPVVKAKQDDGRGNPYVLVFNAPMDKLAGLFTNLAFVADASVSRVRGAQIERTLLIVRENVPTLHRMSDPQVLDYTLAVQSRWAQMGLSPEVARHVCVVLALPDAGEFDMKVAVLTHLQVLPSFAWVMEWVMEKKAQREMVTGGVR